jgi:hypothetical protein
MQRARNPDQRFDTGSVMVPLEACLCMENPLRQRIPRALHVFPRDSALTAVSGLVGVVDCGTRDFVAAPGQPPRFGPQYYPRAKITLIVVSTSTGSPFTR